MNPLKNVYTMTSLSLMMLTTTAQAIVHAENRFQIRYRCMEKKEAFPKLRLDVSFNRVTKQWKGETFSELSDFHPAHPDREISKTLAQYDIRPETSKISDPGAIEHEFVDYKTKGENFSLRMKRTDPEPDFKASLKLKEESLEFVCRALIRAMRSGS